MKSGGGRQRPAVGKPVQKLTKGEVHYEAPRRAVFGESDFRGGRENERVKTACAEVAGTKKERKYIEWSPGWSPKTTKERDNGRVGNRGLVGRLSKGKEKLERKG